MRTCDQSSHQRHACASFFALLLWRICLASAHVLSGVVLQVQEWLRLLAAVFCGAGALCLLCVQGSLPLLRVAAPVQP
jgi:hypothetical protein